MSAVKLDKLRQPALAQAQHVDRRRELRVVDGEVVEAREQLLEALGDRRVDEDRVRGPQLLERPERTRGAACSLSKSHCRSVILL